MGVRHATETIVKMIKNVDTDREMGFAQSDCPERLADFMATIKAKTTFKTDIVCPIGAVVGTQAGQGCVGLGYFEK